MKKANSASDALVVSHMRFARGLANQFGRGLPSQADQDALESDALFALLRAARSFDPNRGTSFKTYAGHRIRGAMIDGVRERNSFDRRKRWQPIVISLHTAVAQDGEGNTVTLGDLLECGGEPVGAAIERQDEVDLLLRPLNRKHRSMIRQYYMAEATQAKIGRRHGLSASRVSQQLRAARQQLRASAAMN